MLALLDRVAIEREVRRLSPWYYLWDLDGVRTDITPTCLPEGHRSFRFPPVLDGFWRGKTVLDVACNEGFWSYGAAQEGAAHVDAFDAREINIERARLVARVKGFTGVDLHVETTDSWLARHPERRYDVVMLNGILYHLPDPAATIGAFCALARQWVYVASCLLHGGGPGFTPVREPDNMAASHGHRPSRMPNDTPTLLAEFAKHGFLPIYVEESPGAFAGGACGLMLRDTKAFPDYRVLPPAGPEAGELEIHLAPDEPTGAAERRRPLDLWVAVYSRSARPRSLRGCLVAESAGRELVRLERPLELPARASRPGDSPSRSVTERVRLDLASAEGEARLAVRLEDPATGVLLCERTLVAAPMR